ncbi:Arylsulfatase precursor [Planctomycetes bacterium CA13]|uniref:Arylsulfatase n=1 Tax=Novipirellula herctigrandis TaxID=2527986 RepID=A0A5C5YV57_9BACT|nr:Arylsulfatase precursor [Planctomycetes bacterium CA13]
MKSPITLAAMLLITLSGPRMTDAGSVQPNVIVIVADDMGYSDPACFGGELATPALDRLASEGIRFTHCYNGGMCIVSRASLLTGHWWPKALPEFTRTPLLSERLQQAGYRTAIIGKWHLPGHPMDRGFDHFFGFLNGFTDHFEGSTSYRLDREPFRDFGEDYYSSDDFTDRAIKFIRSSPESDSERPFMLYLSYQAPHNPLQAPTADIRRHRGKYLQGWQAIREARFRRQHKLGIVPADSVLPKYPDNLPDWESLSPAQRDLEDLRMSVYAAMVERMDQGIGRLLEALEESGQAESTLVLFMSDNGTDSFSVVDKPMLASGKLPGDRKSNWQPGTGWAYACVTPWRLYKISQHAGGVTTGAIAWWPTGIREPGRIETSHVHMADVLPTILAASRVDVQNSVAGECFLPVFKGEAWKRKEPLFFQFMDNRAIRTAEWTLAEVDGTGWGLFHVASDPFENDDVKRKHSKIATELAECWDQWWREQSGKPTYLAESTKESEHYRPQGDRGSGAVYRPTAMPAKDADRYPIP